MPIGPYLEAWRLVRGHSLDHLAEKAGVLPTELEAIEQGQVDPPVSLLDRLAGALSVPPSWLHVDPRHIDLVTPDPEEEDQAPSASADPVIDSILTASGQHRELFALLTRILQSEDPKLIRAAEVSLRSLVKQARAVSVPWQSRPPGHFEPPTD